MKRSASSQAVRLPPRMIVGIPRKQLRPAAVTCFAALAIVFMLTRAFGDLAHGPDAALVKSDFAAFYCGALVASSREDPYALSPLRSCEARRVDLPGGADPAVIGVDPDPLPGYTVALFEPLTLLSYREAALIWDALLLIATAVAALTLALLTGLPWIVVAAILSFIAGALVIPEGQLAPIVLLGLTLAAYGLVTKKAGYVLAGSGLALIEPHVGIPSFCALFVWRPELRLRLAGIAAALCAIGVAALGPASSVEYVMAELPAHAIAEGTTSIQYSLTFLLHYVGLSDANAIRIASIQYALCAATAALFAGPVARKLGTPAAIVFFPAAVALLGGPFIHLQQMGAAIPLALVVAVRTRGAVAASAWISVALLAVPWDAGSRLFTAEAALIVVTIALTATQFARPAFAVGAAACAVLVYAIVTGPILTRVIPAFPQHVVAMPQALPRALNGSALASDQDAYEVRSGADFAIATPRTLAAKLPTWLALCAIIAVTLRVRGLSSAHDSRTARTQIGAA